MSAELKLKFTGDASGATSAINSLGNSLNKLKPATNTASFALTNLSRVAQDAPFGFIGIANNIDPLITSFQSLYKETGSAKAAFSALGASLAGGGGLILITGLASAAMSLFGDKLFGAQKVAKEAEATFRSVAEAQAEAVGSTRERAVELQILTDIVKDTSRTEAERLSALREIKKVDEDLTKGITLQASSLEILTDRVREYTNAILAKNIADEFGKEIGKLSVEEAKRALDVEKARLAIEQARAKLELAKRAPTASSGSVAAGGADVLSSSEIRNAQQALDDAVANFAEQEKQLFQLGSQRLIFENAFVDAKKKEVSLMQQFNGENDKALGTEKKRFDMSAFFAQNQIDIRDGVAKLDDEFQKQFAKVGQSSAQAFGSAFNLDANLELRRIEGLAKKVAELQSLGLNPPSIESLIANPNANASFLDVLFPPDIVDQAAARKKLVEESILSIATGVQDALISVADSIGAALGRGGGIGQVLAAAGETLLRVIGGVLQDVGKQVIVASGLVKLMQKALASLFTPAGPAAGLAIGASLIALGAVLRNIRLTKVQPFAEGGVVMGPTMGLVGEAGKEAIIPLDRIGDVLGSIGAGQSVFVSGRLSGETIYLQQQRTGDRRSRFV